VYTHRERLRSGLQDLNRQWGEGIFRFDHTGTELREPVAQEGVTAGIVSGHVSLAGFAGRCVGETSGEAAPEFGFEFLA
jgi:hypothetical protein